MDRKEIKKKKKKFSEHDPEKYINLEPSTNDNYFREAIGATAVISFGRFNPITVGHEKLANKVIAEAIRRKATPMIFMSHSQDPKKNPLSYEDKISYGRKAFGKAVIKSKARTIIEVAKELTGKFDNLVIIVGQDRVKEFETLLNKYNGKEFNFNNIEIVSAGARDPDAEGVEGMSASKMRSIAQEGNFQEFQKGLPKKLKSSAKEIYDAVRSGMNLSEEYLEESGQLSISQRRRRGLVMKRYKTKIAAARKRARRRKASPEKLKLRAQRKALEIIRQRLSKNKSYKEMSPTEKIALDKRLARVPQTVLNRIARRELPKVKKSESERLTKALSPKKEDLDSAFENFIIEKEDPDIGSRKGSQPKDYYKGVAKSVKDDRARHFEKHGKMDDNNPAAYKKAPGDEDVKTKTSKHTKTFKQIFGEASCADTKVRKRPHMALEKNGSVKFDRRFKMYRSNNEITEDYEDLSEDLTNLVFDMDNFIMSEEFDSLMESNPTEALKNKAEKTGISYGILKKVFDRGVAAWRTGHRPGTTPTQWGLARVNSFATKGKGTWGKADSDLASKVKKEEVELGEAESPTAVKPFVQTRTPDKAAKVSDTIKHKLGIGLSMKHMLQHGIHAVDKDNDGDVDAFEKKTPDEITGAEKKNLTKLMQKKLAGEVKHSKIGHAFESESHDETFVLAENALKALRWATHAHSGQKRRSGEAYIQHPKEVARFVKQFKKSNNLDALISAAYLHDTIEDTDTTYKDLVKQFGALVAGMVKELTSDKKTIEALGKGEYIAQKMAKMSSWALVVKLADRLANVQDMDNQSPEFQKKYANQTKLALDRLKKDRYLSKTHGKLIAAIEDKIKEYVTEEIIFTLDEAFEMRNLDEASIMDKVLEKIHKYVLQGTELSDIAFQISRAAGVNSTGKELEKKYIDKYGEPHKAKYSPTKEKELRKKYGFAEAAETQFEHGSYKTENFDICPSAKAAFNKNVEGNNYDSKLISAAKAVDEYLGIEKDLRSKDEVTEKDLVKMTDSVDTAKEEIKKARLQGHNYHDIHVDNVKDMMKEVNENEQTERVKERIRAEKERDKRKHDRMLDAAKMKDLGAELKKEGSENPSDREWGTDSLTKTYKKDTPGEDMKEESPYTKDLPKGSRVRFPVQKITGKEHTGEGTVVGTDPDTLRLRIRDANGKIHIVKHEDADKIG